MNNISTKSQSFKFIAAAVLLIFCQIKIANAEHVLPVFSGYWYTAAKRVTPYEETMDSCGIPTYSYENRYKGSIEEVAEILSNPPPGFCPWGKVGKVNWYKFPEATPDFYFSVGDRDKILSNPKSVLSVMAWRQCLDGNGDQVDSTSVIIYPSYTCPPGSNFDSVGCSTTPACTSDLVARDLNVIGAHSLGHVGLVAYHGSVIQVLAKDTPSIPRDGIYINTLDSFKHVPGNPFWGVKYGLREKNMLTKKDAEDIYNTAFAQIRYTLDYTKWWDFHPGGTNKKQVYNQQAQQWQITDEFRNALFRCDSFIYYAYLAGAKLTIFPEFKFPLVPRDMFNAFLYCRGKEGKLCGEGGAINTIYSVSPTAQLNAVFSAPTLNIPQADYTTEQYIKDPHIPRSVKVNELWSLAIKFQDNEDKFNYLVDGLAFLKPFELTPELIQHFQSERNSQNQLHLLRTLTEMLENQYPSLPQSDQLLNVIQIQNFVEDLLKTSTDRDILRRAIQGYAAIFPAEKAQQDIEKAFARKDITHLQALFSDQEKIFLDLNLAFANPQQQQKNLPQLMKYQFNENQRLIFSYALCSTLNVYNPNWIDDMVREVLKQFLLKNKSVLFSISYAIEPQSYLLQPQLRYLAPCNWLDAYATVMTHNEIEKRQFILNHIRNEENIFTQAALIEQNSKKTTHLSDEERLYYRTRFENALKQKKLTDIEWRTLMSGISAINSKPH